MRQVSNIILESSKSKNIYKNIVLTSEDLDVHNIKVTNLLSLCPTRWCVRVNAMNRFVENYCRIQKTLDEIIQIKMLYLNEKV